MYKSRKVEIPRNTGTGKKELKKKEKSRKASYWERTSKKKQVIILSDFEIDVEADVQHIMASKIKKIAGKRVPENILPAAMDNISFHSEESVQKWKYV
ncbi:envelope-like protein, partial [Trifolium medium]|nr:envelope-like protein [Trifolium medium]